MEVNNPLARGSHHGMDRMTDKRLFLLQTMMFIRQQMVYKSEPHFVNRWHDIQRRRRKTNALDDYEEGSWTPTLAICNIRNSRIS